MLLNVTALCALVFLICYTAEMLAPHDQVRHWQSQALMGFSGIIGSAWPVLRLMGLSNITAGQVLVALVATLFLVITANERLMYGAKLRRSRLTTNQ